MWFPFLVSIFLISQLCYGYGANVINATEKARLKDKVVEMFDHAYGAYKKYAHPADELMPLSCRGRYRGSETDRGDIDEALGNFSLTLIDTLDTLAVLGQIEEFETQVLYVIRSVTFDNDVVVSVFETNIRILGGLLGAHSMAITLKKNGKGLDWYDDELLKKAMDIADRLLPAFNTSTGIPYPKINLRYGIHHEMSRVGGESHTCTACAGTMIMEFGALSRLTGISIYEEKAHKAMEALWTFRSRHSDLVGTTINIHNGDWNRRDSGVGAGIDSYYEYCLKAYILLGDETYRDKFNKHYAAISKYIRQGYMLLDVYMHQPNTPARPFVDALQAFWPGLQVLKGDLKQAIETHEMLYNVAKKFKFIPEAFTTNFDLHWAQHPLRPEFIESTYFLYQATKDPYYLEAGKHVIDTLEDHARVKCGFAAFNDLRTFAHEDKMDSFVLAETFKYLYLLFSEESEHIIDVHDFVFTTEAHLLPLYLSVVPPNNITKKLMDNSTKPLSAPTTAIISVEIDDHSTSCPNTKYLSNLNNFAEVVRKKVNSDDKNGFPSCKKDKLKVEEQFVQMTTENFLNKIKVNLKGRERKIYAKDFNINNQKHLNLLVDFGIKILKEANGKVQLQHQSTEAKTKEDAEEGILFMQEMIQISKEREDDMQGRVVKLTSSPFHGNKEFKGGYAQFGFDLNKNAIMGELVKAAPYRACQHVENSKDIINRIVVVERGGCMFIDKARIIEKLGGIGIIIVDHNQGTSSSNSAPFGMSGDNNSNNVGIPAVFLFNKEGEELLQHMKNINNIDGSRIRAILMIEGKNPVYNDNENNKENKKDQLPKHMVEQSDFGSKLDESFFTNTNVEIVTIIDGKKVTTSVSEYVGPNEEQVIKKFERKTIQTCQNVECTETTIEYFTAELDIDEKTLLKYSENEEKNEITDTSGKQNKPKKIAGKEDGETYIDDVVSEVLKKKIANKESGIESGDRICSSAGCFNTIEELQDIQKLASSIMNLQEQLDKNKLQETLKEIKDDIKQSINEVLNDKSKNENKERTSNEENSESLSDQRAKPEL